MSLRKMILARLIKIFNFDIGNLQVEQSFVFYKAQWIWIGNLFLINIFLRD